MLFTFAIIAAFVVTASVILPSSGTTPASPNLGAGALIVALLGAPFLIWRAIVAQTTVDLQKEGLMTDRIAKAVEHLGADKTVKVKGKDADGKDITVEETEPNIEVRIGGLLSLERIAQDSVKYDKGRDHVRVMEILCAYVRENAPAKIATKSWRLLWDVESEGGEFAPGLTQKQFCEKHNISDMQFSERMTHYSLEFWANDVELPRHDIQMALTGR